MKNDGGRGDVGEERGGNYERKGAEINLNRFRDTEHIFIYATDFDLTLKTKSIFAMYTIVGNTEQH
jgi:hypothetical protein